MDSPVIKQYFILDISICKILLHSVILINFNSLLKLSIEINFID
jgi:hypothetical protein